LQITQQKTDLNLPAGSFVAQSREYLWSHLGFVQRTKVIFRSLFDSLLMYERRFKLRHVKLYCLGSCAPLAPSDLPLLLVVRNELALLSTFLKHYRRLGVTRFLVVDDKSSDGSREFLLSQPDVTVFESNVRYGTARKGEFWRQMLIDKFGRNRWYVNVDVDEFLVFKTSGPSGIPVLIADLEAAGLNRSMALMLDFYSKTPLQEAALGLHQSPFEITQWFDQNGYKARLTKLGLETSGGPIKRFFGRDGNRTKFPLIYCSKRVAIPKTIHAPLPYWENFVVPTTALAHFKFFADFEKKCIEAIEDGQRHSKARAQKAYYERIKDRESVCLFDETISTHYRDPNHLYDLGLAIEPGKIQNL
jgi:hypothetical protein